MEQTNILNKTKTLISKTFVQSAMLNDAETWTLGKHQANKLLVTEIDFWQRAESKSRKKIKKLKIRKVYATLLR